MRYAELDELMTKNLNYLKEEVQKLNVEDFMQGTVSFANLQWTHSSRDMPIRVLDSIIQTEETTFKRGANVYNRGE